MRHLRVLGLWALVLGVSFPVTVAAQTAQRRDASRVDRDGYHQGRDDRARRDRDDDDDRRRDREWWESRRMRDRDWVVRRTGNGRGPVFCRSGAGHPVYGRYWCIEQGYGWGRDVRWDRVRWDVVYRTSVPRVNRQLERHHLVDVLGQNVYVRLDTRRRLLGISRPLTGHWYVSGNRSVLVVSAGGLHLAEFVDLNRDRRVDFVFVNFGR